MQLCGCPDSKAIRSAMPSPKTCCCPMTSERVLGRIRSASGVCVDLDWFMSGILELGSDLNFQVIVQSMNKVTIESFSINGSSIRTNNSLESTPAGKIPTLWGWFYTEQAKPYEHVYGVYSDYESDASGEFTATVGAKDENLSKTVITIKSGTYLVFPANGPMPAAIIDAWKAVWEHFSHVQSYARSYETDFEEYSGRDLQSIYIGIKD
jgi:predicted transcriptional regulator YdeE